MKHPWLAAILNLLFFGAGYIYNGKRIGIGCALVLAWLLIRGGEIPIYLTGLVFKQWLVLFLGLVVLQISLATDAYKEARNINKTI